MVTILAVALVLVFLFLACVHFYWALGGQVGRLGAIPELRGAPAYVPGRLSMLLAAGAFGACAALVGAAAGFLETPLPPLLIRRLCFALALLFVLRAIGDLRLIGFFKKVRGSRFAWLDSTVYSPLCVVLAAGVFVVGWSAAL